MQLRGRSTAHNPPNRFERTAYVPDGDAYDPDAPGPRTQLLTDASRTIIATNDSPDLGFDASVNPYRGCEHGCVYCLAPETPILHADLGWRPIGEVRTGEELLAFDEYPGPERTRRLRRARVERVWWSRKPTLRLITESGEVLTTAEHRWLQHRDFRWSRTEQLRPGGHLRRMSVVAEEPEDDDYRAGYLAGLSEGGTAVRAAVASKVDALIGREMRLPPERILAIEPGPTMDVVDIQTSTGTFFAGGLATHNCYARPTHEYLGYSAGLDFETKILVKRDAPALLRKALASPKWQPKVLVMSGVTDPYQPAEAKLRITRGCLEVLAEARNPVGIITKNHRVTRDIDLLRELAAVGAVRVNLSVTSLDPELQRSMEPRTSTPARRLAAIEALSEAGIPVGVMVAPVVPGLTDHEVPAILEAVANAGAVTAGYVALRLPHAVAPLFQQWLERAYPERAARVLARVREMRGGKLYDSRWGVRGRGEGVYADHIATLFKATARRLGLDGGLPPLRTDAFRRPAPPSGPPKAQLGLFDEGAA
ncbi:MAG TPA: PA0069 family radical SAM protein [Longimicrobiales bacterium]|nr:PA0069 family radical SAM protein [Longimicrobiales bacterium]